MSKKDFELLANELNSAWKQVDLNGGASDAFLLAVNAVMDACMKDNPRFDEGKFTAVVYSGE